MGYICVFDCETIPNAPLLRRVFDYSGDDYSVSLQAFNEQESKTGSSFLPVHFHQVVSISAVMADEYGRFNRVSTIEGSCEREIIAKFLAFIDKHNPRLVSFNGRGFDLPMLMVRAMSYNIAVNAYFDTNDKALNKDKWTNYRSRYDGVFHLDLLDHISDFRAVSGLKLDTLCASLNLPGKYDVHGDQVLELYYNGELDKIHEYCQSDVLNTYWLFLKYELLRANITLNDYASYLGSMNEYLQNKCAHMGYSAVFCEYIERELERLNGARSYENDESFDDNTSTKDDENIEPLKVENIDDFMAKNGLSKGAGALKSAKKARKTLVIDEAQEEKLPEINLDDE